MNIEKAKQWIDHYINNTEGEFRQRVHTGEGLLILPPDIYTSLAYSGVIKPMPGNKQGYFFDGDNGQTFITVLPFDNDRRRNGVTFRICNIERQKQNTLLYAQKMGISGGVSKFDELPENVKTELSKLPYSVIVRSLITDDVIAGRHSASRLAVKYGVEYRTVYKWLNGK